MFFIIIITISSGTTCCQCLAKGHSYDSSNLQLLIYQCKSLTFTSYHKSISVLTLQATPAQNRATAADVWPAWGGEDQHLLPHLWDTNMLHVQSVRGSQGLWCGPAARRLQETEGRGFVQCLHQPDNFVLLCLFGVNDLRKNLRLLRGCGVTLWTRQMCV